MTEFYHLETYNPLSRNFNKITRWLNLTDVNLSCNKIRYLPIELGTLPFLQRLNLSHNQIGISYGYGWLWIKQAAIRNNLFFLDISNNLITELPHYIGNLNALEVLKASHNMLTCLPQSIGDIQNLKILDVSYNLLEYLPGTILYLQLQTLDISMNTCLTNSMYYQYDCVIPNLVEISFAILQRHRPNYIEFLPKGLKEHMNMLNRCIYCKRNFMVCYERWIIPYYFQLADHVKICQTLKRRFVLLERYNCFLNCSRQYGNESNAFQN